MDPYLETPALWSDFAASFLTYLGDALNDALSHTYEARIAETTSPCNVPPPPESTIGPDVVVAPPAGITQLLPVTLNLLMGEATHERHIEIRHLPERTPAAVLELLSPANKEEPGRALHLAKRNALALHPVHLVEVDLLLKGQRVPFDEELPPGDYYAFISRGDRRPQCQAYHWTMREPLPAIPIPLLPPDPDVWIDLGAVFRTTYERGRYARSIDYSGPPPIALDPARLAWVTERARTGR
jgi:hypothetical protein